MADDTTMGGERTAVRSRTRFRRRAGVVADEVAVRECERPLADITAERVEATV